MKKAPLLFACVAILTMTLTTSCKSKKDAIAVTNQKEMQRKLDVPAEVEIIFPCSGIDSDEKFLRVNGNGKSKDRTMAKDRAYQNALANLSSKLAGVMSMENSKVGVSTNADGEEFHDKMVAVSKLIAKANVAGYRTSCEKYTQTPGDVSYNCYVTIEFGKEKMVREIYEGLSKEKLVKADYDFDRYMKAFEEDLKEYEKTNK